MALAFADRSPTEFLEHPNSCTSATAASAERPVAHPSSPTFWSERKTSRFWRAATCYLLTNRVRRSFATSVRSAAHPSTANLNRPNTLYRFGRARLIPIRSADRPSIFTWPLGHRGQTSGTDCRNGQAPSTTRLSNELLAGTSRWRSRCKLRRRS